MTIPVNGDLVWPSTNPFFGSGAEQLVVEPGQHRPYEVTYQPLTLTSENRKHNVSSDSSSYYCTYRYVHIEFVKKYMEISPAGVGAENNLEKSFSPTSGLVI